MGMYKLKNSAPGNIVIIKRIIKKILTYLGLLEILSNLKDGQTRGLHASSSPLIGSVILKDHIFSGLAKLKLISNKNNSEKINKDGNIERALISITKELISESVINELYRNTKGKQIIPSEIYLCVINANLLHSKIDRSKYLRKKDIDYYIKSMCAIFILPFVEPIRLAEFCRVHEIEQSSNEQAFIGVIDSKELFENLYNHINFSLGEVGRSLVADCQKYLRSTFSNQVKNEECDFDVDVQQIIEATRRHGCAELGAIFADEQINEIVQYFRGKNVYNSHVAIYGDRVPRGVEYGRNYGKYGSYTLHDALSAPYLLEFANSRRIIGLVTELLGGEPVVYSMHAWWTYKESDSYPVQAQTHEFHRDQDDSNFLAIFLYLTNATDGGDGAIEYCIGSHSVSSSKYYSKININEQELLDNYFQSNLGDGYPSKNKKYKDLKYKYEDIYSIKTMKGAAGSAYVADTYGLHRGTPLINRDRLAVWIRYALVKPIVYDLDGNRPAADICIREKLDKNINRLIVKD